MITEEQEREKIINQIAGLMMAAARTAPKGRGRDTLYIALAERADREKLAARMKEIAEKENLPFFRRDADNLLRSNALILMGTRIESLGLKYCGFCGLQSCHGKNNYPDVPCSFNTLDLGIALGSAVSVAAAHHADNRIMFSVGRAALDLGLVPSEIKIVLGIPLSISSKSIYFDRG